MKDPTQTGVHTVSSGQEIANIIAKKVTDADIYFLAEESDCSTLDARAILEAEAFSDLTGLPLDYQADWRDRLGEVAENRTPASPNDVAS